MVNDILKTIGSTQISLPTGEMMILLALLTLCLLAKATRTGLLTAYFFVFRWGWIFFQQNFGTDTSMFRGYVILGIIIPGLAVIRMWFSSRE
jgi:hypothetical protein